MLDVIGYERTGFLVFLNILMMLLAYGLFRPAITSPFTIPSIQRKTGYFVVLLFCVFAFWGNDWFHMAESYQAVREGGMSHLEDVYLFLIQKIFSNYLPFRVVVWGTALLLYGLTIKVFKIERDIAWLCFVVVGLLWFSYARASLAMAMMYLSFALFNAGDGSIKKKILAILLVVGSYYCHKSASFGIVIILISSITKKIDIKRLLLLLLSLPIMYTILGVLLNQYTVLVVDREADLWSLSVSSAQNYLGSEGYKAGLGLFVQQILERTTYILIAFIGVRASIDKKYCNNIPQRINALIVLLFLMVVTAFMFQFDFGFNTSLLADRFFRFSFIPASLLLSYFITQNVYTRITRMAFYLGLIATFYELLYCFYVYL